MLYSSQEYPRLDRTIMTYSRLRSHRSGVLLPEVLGLTVVNTARQFSHVQLPEKGLEQVTIAHPDFYDGKPQVFSWKPDLSIPYENVVEAVDLEGLVAGSLARWSTLLEGDTVESVDTHFCLEHPLSDGEIAAIQQIGSTVSVLMTEIAPGIYTSSS